jgi:chromosome segregation ATPase
VSSPTFTTQPEPQRSGLLTALVAGALIALVAANIYLYIQIDHLKTDVAKSQEKLLTEVSNLRDTSSVASPAHARRIEQLKQDLETAQSAARNAASQVKAEAQANVDRVARELAAEQKKGQAALRSDISNVKQAADQAVTATNAKVAEVSTDVGAVRSQATATQEELQKTIATLKSARGDLDVQSGLIATNAGELAALKRLGERNIFEFKLGKTKTPQRVGDVMLMLKKTDPKKNKFSVDVTADDKLTEKKDKNINEPLQFYTAKARQPYELVVNSVSKDLIVGYLATPKEQVARQ